MYCNNREKEYNNANNNKIIILPQLQLNIMLQDVYKRIHERKLISEIEKLKENKEEKEQLVKWILFLLLLEKMEKPHIFHFHSFSLVFFLFILPIFIFIGEN